MLDIFRLPALIAALAFLAVFLALTVTRATKRPLVSTHAQPEQTKVEPERSTNADELWNTNPDLPMNEILNNIKSGAVRSTAGGPSISYMLAPFSALLVKLSRESDASSRRIEDLTRQLYVSTIALLVLTAGLFLLTLGLFAKEAYDFYDKYYLSYQDAPKNEQIQKGPSGTP